MIAGLDGRRMSARRRVIVKSDGGCNVAEMKCHLEAWLPRMSASSTLIIHIGTNDTTKKTSEEILNELYELEAWITTKSPVRVIFSTPIMRYDHAKATITTRQLQDKMAKSRLECIDNSNIVGEMLGRQKHHLTLKGTRQLAVNIIQTLKYL